MTDISEQIQSVKSTITEPLPTPPDMADKQAEPKELLERLNWGEPALTIIDTRDREAFNNERIMGAVPMTLNQIPHETEKLLEHNRDIYLYGETDESAAQAAMQLRQAGYENVARLKNGLSGWKAIGGPTEGVYAFSSPLKAAEES